MDIQQIRYFLEVAKHQSYSKAAQRLFVTQPVLTRCIKKMEKELGVCLIVRSTKSFVLTDAGQTLVEYGSRLLQQYADIHRRLQDTADAKSGQLRIASPGVLMDMYFPRLLTRYREEHPGVRVHIRESGSRSVVEDVLEGTADIGIIMLPLENTQRLQIYPLVQDRICVLVNRAHPFAKEKSVKIRQLQNVDLITYDRTTTLYHVFQDLCHKEGFQPDIVFQSGMPNFIMDTVALGSCVGVYPAPMLKQFTREDVVGVPIEPPVVWQIAMITNKERYLSYAAANFLEFAQTFLSSGK